MALDTHIHIEIMKSTREVTLDDMKAAISPYGKVVVWKQVRRDKDYLDRIPFEVMIKFIKPISVAFDGHIPSKSAMVLTWLGGIALFSNGKDITPGKPLSVVVPCRGKNNRLSWLCADPDLQTWVFELSFRRSLGTMQNVQDFFAHLVAHGLWTSTPEADVRLELIPPKDDTTERLYYDFE
ncbi:MAG TPA: hypothetical protein V6D20_01315 [Candidatus Obscuribacterales bacterium]